MRRGKEHYSARYGEAIRLHESGMGVNEIAQKLGISYSAAYHWVKGIRKPGSGNPTEFVEFLRKNGPLSALDAGKRFPKHNEVFLICSRRRMGVKRVYLGRKFMEYSTWYYLEGQEKTLQERIEEIFSKIDEFRKSLKEALERTEIRMG
jgi:predicted transcriptional regulator